MSVARKIIKWTLAILLAAAFLTVGCPWTHRTQQTARESRGRQAELSGGHVLCANACLCCTVAKLTPTVHAPTYKLLSTHFDALVKVSRWCVCFFLLDF
jgi:hypothetical protein